MLFFLHTHNLHRIFCREYWCVNVIWTLMLLLRSCLAVLFVFCGSSDSFTFFFVFFSFLSLSFSSSVSFSSFCSISEKAVSWWWIICQSVSSCARAHMKTCTNTSARPHWTNMHIRIKHSALNILTFGFFFFHFFLLCLFSLRLTILLHFTLRLRLFVKPQVHSLGSYRLLWRHLI